MIEMLGAASGRRGAQKDAVAGGVALEGRFEAKEELAGTPGDDLVLAQAGVLVGEADLFAGQFDPDQLPVTEAVTQDVFEMITEVFVGLGARGVATGGVAAVGDLTGFDQRTEIVLGIAEGIEADGLVVAIGGREDGKVAGAGGVGRRVGQGVANDGEPLVGGIMLFVIVDAHGDLLVGE